MAEDMYRYNETITHTHKFKKLLAKLNLDSDVDTQFAIHNLSRNKNPVAGVGRGDRVTKVGFEEDIKNPDLPYLIQVKDEVKNYGHIYDDIEKEENQRLKLPRLIFKNYNQKSNKNRKKKNFYSSAQLTAAKKHEMYHLRKLQEYDKVLFF